MLVRLSYVIKTQDKSLSSQQGSSLLKLHRTVSTEHSLNKAQNRKFFFFSKWSGYMDAKPLINVVKFYFLKILLQSRNIKVVGIECGILGDCSYTQKTQVS